MKKREFTGLVSTRQMPVLEFEKHGHAVSWLIWLSYNHDRTEGIYLRLHFNGMITRESLAHDGSISNVSTIKPRTRNEAEDRYETPGRRIKKPSTVAR